MENSLRLHHHDPDTRIRLAKYLHTRTDGSISSLSHLVRAAAISAIADGSERITRPLLQSIPVDHSTQSSRSGTTDDEKGEVGDAA
ncbi:hypothetical protein [Streptomyces sp. URMC 123]|uniref:hypothetical protein n=1 Tax=Streptomyces sp. URMC 123 TaxID=3423403 RepID=UPI003F1A9DC4